MPENRLHTIELDYAELAAVHKSVAISLSVAAKKLETATGRRATELRDEWRILSDAQQELDDALRLAIVGTLAA